MKRKARALFDPFSAYLSTEHLMKISGQKMILPFYHSVTNERLPHISNLYALRKIDAFKADLDFLLKHYTPITVDEVYQISTGEKVLEKPVFHLTFDDGLKEIKTVIAPILKEKGIPATVFLNTDFVDNKQLFYRYKVSLIIEQIRITDSEALLKKTSQLLKIPASKTEMVITRILQLSYSETETISALSKIWEIDFNEFLHKEQPYLNSRDIDELKDEGITFGSHSCNHPLFSNIDEKEKKHQVLDSLLFLKEKLDINKPYFSFPFTDDGVSKSFIEWLHQYAKIQLTFGTAGLKKDVLATHLQRIPMEGNNLKAKQIIHTEYLYYMLKKLLNKNKVNRR